MALALGVNSYATIDEANSYFEDRIDIAAWDEAADDMKEKALVTATRFLESSSYAGYVTASTQNLAWPRAGSFYAANRGRTVSFTSDYVWAELNTEDSVKFLSGLKALPYEIQLIKQAVFEEAYHLINNDGLFDSTGTSPESIRIGSITLEGLGSSSEAPKHSTVAREYIKPLLGGASRNIWFRAN